MTEAGVQLDDLAKAQQRWQRRRRRARRFTGMLVFGGLFLGAPNFVSCIAHSMVDSEVGVMMNGLPLLIGLMLLGPLVAASTVVWGLGMRKARLGGEQISFWELWCFRVIAAVIMLILWGFLMDPLYRFMRWIGF